MNPAVRLNFAFHQSRPNSMHASSWKSLNCAGQTVCGTSEPVLGKKGGQGRNVICHKDCCIVGHYNVDLRYANIVSWLTIPQKYKKDKQKKTEENSEVSHEGWGWHFASHIGFIQVHYRILKSFDVSHPPDCAEELLIFYLGEKNIQGKIRQTLSWGQFLWTCECSKVTPSQLLHLQVKTFLTQQLQNHSQLVFSESSRRPFTILL